MPDIDRKRILFAGSTSHPEHLLACQQVDLFLDPFPHNGGVSSLENAYMGVPFVTRYGTNPAGRLGTSILNAMGRREWVALSVVDYVETAVFAANDRDGLAAARKTLRADFLASPIVTGYREAVEQRYRELWREHCDADGLLHQGGARNGEVNGRADSGTRPRLADGVGTPV
jgi:predicted O-linked N-acetylglucosamine transferase (SPINDLY family)